MTDDIRKCLAELAKVRSLSTNRVFLYDGKPIDEIKNAFKTALRRAGIADFRFHDLRHCAATNLRRAGIDPVTAMKIVGHKSEKMYRRYNSVNEDDLLRVIAKINTVITHAISMVSVPAVSA